MKIVVAHNFYQQAGGEDVVFHAEVDLLREFGHEVVLFQVHNDSVKQMGRLAQIQLPPLAEDAVAYIAQNPARRSEYAIATYKRSVYLSQDDGKSWRRIADSGRGE